MGQIRDNFCKSKTPKVGNEFVVGKYKSFVCKTFYASEAVHIPLYYHLCCYLIIYLIILSFSLDLVGEKGQYF